MAISDFALNYKKEVTLNYSQMHQISKAVAARMVEILERAGLKEEDGIDSELLDSDGLEILASVSRLLEPHITEAVNLFEEELAKEESKDLEDTTKLQKWLDGEDLDIDDDWT